MSYSPISASDALNQLTAEETLEFDQIIADGVTYNVNDFNTKEDLFALYLTAGTVYVRNTLSPSLWYPIGDNIASNVAAASQIVDSLNGINTKVMTLSKPLTPAMEAALSNSGANVGSTALAPITNTELAVQSTGKTLRVTTKGILTKVPYSKALTAGAAALGVGLGIGFVETNPELATKVSNRIFGTNIEPDEIANIVENTSVWANIVDGATFLAEDFIDAIKDVFIEERVYQSSGPNEYGSFVQIPEASYSECILTYGSVSKLTYKYRIDVSQVIDNFAVIFYGASNGYGIRCFTASTNPAARNIEVYRNYTSNLETELSKGGVASVTSWSASFDGVTYYGRSGGAAAPGDYVGYKDILVVTGSGNVKIYSAAKNIIDAKPSGADTFAYLAYLALSGAIEPGSPEILGIELENGATYPDSSKTLAEDYPSWWDRRTTSDTISDGSESSRNWLEVNTGDPTSQSEAQDGELKDSSQLEDAINGIEETVDENTDIDESYDPQEQPYPNPNPAPGSDITPVTPDTPTVDTSDGESPDPTIPTLTTVVTSGLSYIYNPTLAQTKQLGKKLWTLSFIENLKKIFVDPMQAIIGMHILYATPKTAPEEDIVLGFYNTEVPAKVVKNQYVTIDCGTISVNEYFKDARDYEPYTKVSAYLPFIGIVDLKADDIINSHVNISYNIDVLTGTCLCYIKILKGSAEAAIYSYVGNCAVSVPLSTGNYTAVLTALLGVASFAVGGSALMGIAANVPRAKLQVQQSGNLGANAGALGIRKPYLIIRRPVTNDAYAYNVLYGYPAFKWKKLGGCNGFTKVRSVHLDNVKCSDEEKNMIIEALSEGVIF